jgi:peptidoglycan/xylan/chitin deacetylase (PgdA/CDA1 family)
VSPGAGPGVAVLMYHWVDTDLGTRLRRYGVLPETFARQMAWLERSGRRCLPLETLCDLLERRTALPARSFVLTFDDGYTDLERTVRPVLERHGFTATVFTVTGHVGGTNAWDAKHGDPPRALLDWDAIRRLEGGVFRFESHSCTHPFLTEVPPERARSEIVDSKREIEDRLGRAVTTFSYPHGLFNRRIEELVREAGYRCAATDIRGLNRRGDDPLRVSRVMMTSPDRLPGFVFKVRTGHDLRSGARALAGLRAGAPED